MASTDQGPPDVRARQTIRHRLRRFANNLLRPLDLQIVRRSELVDFLGMSKPEATAFETVSAEAQAYLSVRNPRLHQLRERYRGHPAASHSKWTPDFVRETVDLRLFRRDNSYVYQTRHGITDAVYVLTAYHTKQIDRLGLWRRLTEDGAFGCHLVDFNGERLVSRDLLDSIIEIIFLEECLTISSRGHVRFLDVGAGYGRLAHRLCEAFPHVADVMCADAVPESTFLSEFYLRFRGLEGCARVVPLDEVEQVVVRSPPDVASNIHSFSEMPVDAIAWWVGLLARAGVRWLVIAPNTGERLVTTEPPLGRADRGELPRRDFSGVLESAGYRLRVKRPKYGSASSLQAHGLFPTWYFLFELT